MEDEALLASLLIGQAMAEHLTRQAEPDYTAFAAALQELAAEYLAELDWRLLPINGQQQGGTRAAWKSWLTDLGATYRGVVRLELAIMAAARERDQTSAPQELSA